MYAIDKLADADWIIVAGNSRQGFPQITFNWSIQRTFSLKQFCVAQWKTLLNL